MKVKIKAKINRNTVEEVMEAFYKISKTEKNVKIKDNEISVEIFLEDISKGLIAAISKCEEIVFEYGQISTKISKKEELEWILQELKDEKNISNFNKFVVQKQVLEINDIAKKCASYEEFIEEVTKWIDFGMRNDFFVNLVKAATQIEYITWPNIKAELESNEVYYKDSAKSFCGNRVTEKFEKTENPLTILKLIKILVSYKEFKFLREEQKLQQNADETLKKTKSDLNRVKIDCIPEIPWFEEILGSCIDKTKSMRYIIKSILTAMGLNKIEEQEQMKILQIVYVAAITEKYEIDEVFREADIPEDEHEDIRLIIFNFVNKFLERNGFSQNVNEAEFIADLVKILV